jgi:hypothetical protein
MANYCSPQEAAALTGRPTTEIQGWWMDVIDALIDKYTSQGYKGAERSYTHMGTGNTLVRLPSKANQILSITENGTLLDPSEYTLEVNGRHLERAITSYYSSLYGLQAGCWYRRFKYVITYVEPDIDEAPLEYRLCAADCAATVALFVQKRKEYGIALSASDAGSAGKVSTAASTSFPASLIDDLRRIITGTLKRGSV